MHTYRKYDPTKDDLEKKTLLKLGGLYGYSAAGKHALFKTLEHWLCLSLEAVIRFPELEVAEESLTISKRLKEEIESRYALIHRVTLDEATGRIVPEKDSFIEWLDSLEETD